MARAWFVGLLFWALHASSEAALVTGSHPLCRILEGQRHSASAKLPAWYTCRGGQDGEVMSCSASTPRNEPARRASSGPSDERMPTVDSLSLHATVSLMPGSSSVGSTWLVCEGDRDSDGDQGIEGRSWIDCEGYFAVSGIVEENPSQFCRSFRRDLHHQEYPRRADLSVAAASPAARELASSTEVPADEVELDVGMSAGAESEQQLTANDETPADVEPTTPEQQPVDAKTDLAIDDDDDGSTRDRGVPRMGDRFVRIREEDGEGGCDEVWASWPAVQEAAVEKGTVVMFGLFPAVGNIFIVLENLIKVVRLLEVAVVLDWRGFEGFRVAFDPADVMWDLDPGSILESADQVAKGDPEQSGLHSLKFADGVMILTGSQLELLALEMDIAGKDPAETVVSLRDSYPKRMRQLLLSVGRSLPALPPCAWNFLLRRSPSMSESLAANSPWAHNATPKDYVAWHIRTSDGESAWSFKPDVHTYIFHGQSSSDVCPLYMTATTRVESACQDFFPDGVQAMPIYISSNSKSMSRNCTSDAANSTVRAGFVDLGISDSDAHTSFSKDPELTAVSAFIDYLFLMDAAMIVRTRSSFSGTVAKIKGLHCKGAGGDPAVGGLTICMPRGC